MEFLWFIRYLMITINKYSLLQDDMDKIFRVSSQMLTLPTKPPGSQVI